MSDNGNSGGNSGPELIPQPHGGALLSGGVPGHAPPPGRPPSELKKAMRGILEEAMPQLREFAIGRRKKLVTKKVTATCPECEAEVSSEIEVEIVGPPRAQDQLKAMELASRYGLDVKVDKGLVDELWSAIEDLVPEAQQAKVKHQFNLIVGRRLAEAVVT